MRVELALLVGLAFLGCGGGGSSSSPPADFYPSCKNGKYILDDPMAVPGGFDSAACVEFMKAIPTIQTDATKAPEFITPLAGAILPATPVAKFTWSKGTLSMLRTPSFWDELRHELAIENVAHAAPDAGSPADAGSTFTSDAYVIIFRAVTADGGLSELLRVMTINLSFTPTDAQWAAFQAVGAPATIEASVYGMHFDSGKIVGGVYTPPQARAFTVSQ